MESSESLQVRLWPQWNGSQRDTETWKSKKRKVAAECRCEGRCMECQLRVRSMYLSANSPVVSADSVGCHSLRGPRSLARLSTGLALHRAPPAQELRGSRTSRTRSAPSYLHYNVPLSLRAKYRALIKKRYFISINLDAIIFAKAQRAN